MVNLLDTILNAGGGDLVKQMAGQVGLGENDAKKAVTALTPALSRGIANNVRQEGGLETLLGALASGQHAKYIDEPQRMTRPETITDGNAILGHILGGKDVSRNVAGHAAEQTGIDAGILKQMLPMLATAAMGSLGKQTSSMAAPAAQSSGFGGLGGVLGSLTGGGQQKDAGMAGIVEGFLDSDNDGAVVDDLLSMAKKFF